MIPGEDDDEEEELNGSMMAVEGSDGQQYVVLEVIQLQVIKFLILFVVLILMLYFEVTLHRKN